MWPLCGGRGPQQDLRLEAFRQPSVPHYLIRGMTAVDVHWHREWDGGVRAAPNIVITAAMADKLGAVSGENFADLTSVSPQAGTWLRRRVDAWAINSIGTSRSP